MSASPTNAPQVVTKETSAVPPPVVVPDTVRSTETTDRQEALQALLAFSALHQQVRERRRNRGSPSESNPWEVEQFVLDEVLQLVAERALAITGADGVAVALAEGEEIVCRGSAGGIAPDTGARLDPHSGFSGQCFRSGQVIRCDDAEHDPRVNLQAALLLGARSIVAVPLKGQNCALGLIEAFSYDAYGFNDSDVRSLSLLAELILAALRPEEEDRLAQISRQVIARSAAAAPIEIPVRNEPGPAEESAEEVEVESQPLALVPEPSSEETSHPGLIVVFAVVLVAVMLGSGILWKYGKATRAAIPAAPAPAQVPTAQTTPSSEDDASSADPMEALGPQNLSDQKLSVLPRVTGIRHWSSADTSTVVIDIQDQVQYEAHRLTNPERIYFDLHDTAVAPELLGKTIEVGDTLLTRIRIAQPMSGITRVVLDTKEGSHFSVSLEPNPYRMVVVVRSAASKNEPRPTVDLFGPPNPSPVAPVPAVGSDLRIVLDAGHGGWDLGTVGRQGLLEKDLVLDIVERLGSLVEKRMGAQVIYTRRDDNYIALEKRAEIANQAGADLFLSIHANYSSTASARGVETYYTNTFSSVHAYMHTEPGAKLQPVSYAKIDIRDKVRESRKIAANIQHALYGALAGKSPEIRNRGVKEASYVVLTGTSMPAVLAEVSFVSSPTDETNLQSATYRQAIAEALYKGLAGYVSGPRKVKVANLR